MRTGRPSRIKWTQEQLERIKQDYERLGPRELARQMGIGDVQCLNNRANTLGLKSKTPFKWTKELNKVLTARFQTDGPTVLAKELGIPYWTLFSQCRRLGLGLTRKAPAFVEWTEEKIQLIRDRYVKEGGDQLAKEFGCELRLVQDKASEMGLHTNAGHKRWGDERAQNNTSCNIRYFDTWTPNMAYILGFLFADGNVNKELTTVGINLQARDVAVLKFIRKEIKVKSKIRKIPPCTDPNAKVKAGPGVGLGISSKVLVQGAMKLGLMPRKTYEDYPYYEVPDEVLPHFLRGNFDGDGTTTSVYGGVHLQGSPKFIIGLHNAIVRVVGVSSRRINHKIGKTTTYSLVGWGRVTDIRLLYDFMYPKDFGFCLKRKKKCLDIWLSKERKSSPCKPFTAEDLEIIKNNYHKLGATETARILNRDVQTVRDKAAKSGLRIVPKRTEWTEEEVELLKKDYKSQGPTRLGKLMNRPSWVVRHKAISIGLSLG